MDYEEQAYERFVDWRTLDMQDDDTERTAMRDTPDERVVVHRRPLPVTVISGDGVETREMTDAEYKAWRDTLDDELDQVEGEDG